MLSLTVLLVICALATGQGEWTDESTEDERYLLITVRKMVIADVVVVDIKALFHEAWCGPWDGNSLEDICESMCPLYYGGAQATYEIYSRGGVLNATKLEDVIANPSLI
ncbi:unnamed protein product [Nippostrongylus brasiliensis]|uniref:Inhibitor_I29 domain-containing protein n=1 Tax=Nippostrongylus brasiliensis TaxID=27835 RepID=A0A0N4XX48_NIPBR|nr:unnamed protein product [Nippostrongylus brasiliensis]